MEQYIPKAAVVAEIDSILKSVEHTSHCDEISFNSGRWKALTSIKDFLDTLEVKEVDLKKEYEKYYEQERYIQTFKLAKHFFELGLKAKNMDNE